MSVVKSEVGNRYSLLLVLDRAGSNSQKQATWECVCDCGNKVVVSGVSLRRGWRKSCDCLRGERLTLPHGEASFNNLYGHYMRNASNRNIHWGLTREDFRELTSQDCQYCGVKPVQVRGESSGYNGLYKYNGIDRVDSSVGYTKKNVVPCCKECNMMKRSMPTKEFLLCIKRIYKYNYS